jgi:hypothetical protein
MAGHGEKLTRLQDQAVSALLQATTIEAAAAQVGVNEKTLRQWLKLPQFVAEYRSARRQLVERAVATMQQSASTAAEALTAVLKDEKAKHCDVIRAAKVIIEAALKGVELLDIETRVEAVEQAVKQRRNGR